MKGREMELDILLQELEQLGIDNDSRATERSHKLLNITRDTGEFLALMITATGAKRVLEIGTSNGYSTLWLASAVADAGKVTTLELSAEKAAMARNNFQRAGLQQRIELIEGSFVDWLRENSQIFDLLFLDSNRSLYMDVAEEIVSAIRPGGLLVVDNAQSHAEELAPFIECIRGRDDFVSALVPVGKGEFLATRRP